MPKDKDVQLTVRMSSEMLAELKAAAKEQDESVSRAIRAGIKWYLKIYSHTGRRAKRESTDIVETDT